MAVQISGTTDKKIYREGGERSVKISGSGFVYGDDGKKHELDLVVVVLKSDGSGAEDPKKLKVYPTNKDDILDDLFPAKIEAFTDAELGARTIIIKARKEKLIGGKCDKKSASCSGFDEGISIVEQVVAD